MIVLTCGCAHSWVIPTTSALAWTRAVMTDPCPACGNVGGVRYGSTFPDPNIREVIAGLDGCKYAPVAILERSVLEPPRNTTLVLVAVRWRVIDVTMETVCEVDRQTRTITKTWLGAVAPYKTGLRRLPMWGDTRGILYDVILTLAAGDGPITDWQAWVASTLHNAGNRGIE